MSRLDSCASLLFEFLLQVSGPVEHNEQDVLAWNIFHLDQLSGNKLLTPRVTCRQQWWQPSRKWTLLV